MGHEMADQILLPVTVTSKPAVIRLQRELEALDTALQQASLRKTGQTVQLPTVTQALEALAQANNGNLLQTADRLVLKQGLDSLLKKAPVVHISFADAPSQKFLERLTTWFRQEIDATTLVEVGLQPSIAAGCTLRTTSKYFDLSLRQSLASKQPMLLEKLRGSSQ